MIFFLGEISLQTTRLASSQFMLNNSDQIEIKKFLPKIIAINDIRYKNAKNFINLGPIDLIKKQNSNHLFYFNKGFLK